MKLKSVFSIPLPLFLACLLMLPLAKASEAITLSEEEFKHLDIQTTEVAPADFEVTTYALGWTESIPENRSVLSSRVPGRVIENRIEIGEFVEKGTELLLIESRQPGNPPASVWLTAPADGNILKMNALLGAPVDPADKLAELADLRRLYLIVMLPQATAAKIVQGTKARVKFPLRPNIEYMATLRQHTVCACPDPACALGLDMSTRNVGEQRDFNSAGVVFTLENPHSELRPEMNAECSIILEERKGVLAVPQEAVQGIGAGRHVFVADPELPRSFHKVVVRPGITSNGKVEILEGLKAGDAVVTQGAYLLGYAGGSSISLKEMLDAAHGHEHNEDGSEKDPSAAGGAHDHAHDDHADHPHDDHAHDANGNHVNDDHTHEEPAGHAHDDHADHPHDDHAHDENGNHVHDDHADHPHEEPADHAHEAHGLSLRDFILIGAALLFAVLWLTSLLRRSGASSKSKTA